MRTAEAVTHLGAIAILIAVQMFIIAEHLMPVALFALINAWGFVLYTNKDHE